MTPQARILCHRGLWDSPEEGNSLEAIFRSISEGYGVEFDIRDHLGHVVIAHDPPSEGGSYVNLESLLDGLANVRSKSNLAINVKSDGLQPIIPIISNPHFFFDMSFPDQLAYQRANRRIGIRISEFEQSFSMDLLSRNEVLWVDAFETDWYLEKDVFRGLMETDLTKVFVSPELHGREYENVWSALRPHFLKNENVMICTDYPREFLASL